MSAALKLEPCYSEIDSLSENPRLENFFSGQVPGWEESAVNDGEYWEKTEVSVGQASEAWFLNQDSYLGEINTPPSLHRYLYAFGNPLVYIDLGGNEAVDIANGVASSVMNMMFGGEVSPRYIKTFDPEYTHVIRESTGTFDRIYNNHYDKKFKVDFRDWSITKSYTQAPTLGQKLKSLATLGIKDSVEATARTAAAVAVSADDSIPKAARDQADFDVGGGLLDIAIAAGTRKGRQGGRQGATNRSNSHEFTAESRSSRAPEGTEKTETFYRTMSEEHYKTLQETKRMPGTGETSTSPTREFAENYNGVTVEFKVKPGTTEKLEEIGVGDGTSFTKQQHPSVPTKEKGVKWNETNARFKTETLKDKEGKEKGKQVNIQLGRGKGLDTFNENIVEFNEISRRKKDDKQ